MLIQSLKQHFPARLPEWWMALFFMIPWGAYTVLHPQMWTDPRLGPLLSGMAGMVAWTGYPPSAVWGLAALFVGSVRAGALFVNGAYHRTPIIRLITSAMSAFLVSQILDGVIKTGVANFGIVTYSTLFLLDLASAYRAASDIPIAEGHRVRSIVGRG